MKKLLVVGCWLLGSLCVFGQRTTQPGVRISGTHAPGNVVIFGDGGRTLQDSGVAPTNLVSVTNLTADIAANTARIAESSGLRIINSDGSASYYAPASDSDAARGVALDSALSALSNNSTLIVPHGTYTMSNGTFLLENLTNINIIGIGYPRLEHNNTQTDVRRASYEVMSSCQNVLIKGISFYTEILDATYTSNHGYSLVVDGSGLVEDCYVTLYSTVTNIQSGYSFKTIVHVADQPVELRDCTIQTFNAVAGMTNQFFVGAHHDSSNGRYTAYTDCKFLSQNVSSTPFVTSPETIAGCWANNINMGRSTYLNRDMALTTVNPHYSDLLDTSFYAQYTRGIAPGKYTGAARVLIGSDTNVLFEIVQESAVPQVKEYEIKISAGVTGGSYYYFYHAFVRNGTATAISTGAANSAFIFTANATGTPDTFSLIDSGSGTRSAHYAVEMISMPARASDGVIRDRVYLVPKDVIE